MELQTGASVKLAGMSKARRLVGSHAAASPNRARSGVLRASVQPIVRPFKRCHVGL
ncbi:hypothetical protein TorRG33x02_290280 [Trema orientale]|uniref:Uncharacterized protein n=1 Tax=Trema orientale TaxID=63057 RepID=A0A2P5CCI5_TREOI|nr:hypothetical protein TorRG33x02_290280 [Trema orientale]